MAQPITLELPTRDPREELRLRLEQAPIEHAEALLASFDVLQGLYDAGALDLMHGMLAGSAKILDTTVDAVNTPEAIRGLRNLIILTKILGAVDPEVLEKYAQNIPNALEAAAQAQKASPPGFWQMLRILRGDNLRRGLAVLNGALEALGRNFSGRRH